MSKPKRTPRDIAREAGRLTFIGSPCRRGHTSGERLVSNGVCVECSREDGRAPKRISRDEARAQGLAQFWDGRECRRGHRSPRRVSDGTCTACERMWKRREIVPGETPPGRPPGIADARQLELADQCTAALRRLKLIDADATWNPVAVIAVVCQQAMNAKDWALALAAASKAAPYLFPTKRSVSVDVDADMRVEVDNTVGDIFARVVSAEVEEIITAEYTVVDDD